MGLLSSRNLRKAKELLDKNRHKAGDIVGKAGETLDKVSKGKTSNLTSKATDAANKYAAGASTAHDFGEPSGDHDGMPADVSRSGSTADVNAAGVAAATAMTNMANAATNFLNSAAAQAQAVAAQQAGDGAAGSEASDAPSDPSAPPPLPG